jgi:hypothetical protein
MVPTLVLVTGGNSQSWANAPLLILLHRCESGYHLVGGEASASILAAAPSKMTSFKYSRRYKVAILTSLTHANYYDGDSIIA